MWRAGVSIAAAAISFATFAAGCGDDGAMDHDDDHSHGMEDAGHVEKVPCPASTPEFVLGLEATGKDGHVTARLLDADWIPPRKGTNDWSVEFLDADGMPVEDMEITKAESFMPVHNHDGRYPPTITALDDPGTFQLDNINLHMGGPWEVRFTVDSESAGSDYIVFNVCVDD